MNIDWSKAPEGVLGYHPEKNGYVAHWVRWEPNGDNWLCVLGFESSGWVEAHSRMGEKYLAEIINAPAAWNGEGLPPVGTVCEFAGGTHCPDDPFDKDLKEGMQVTIIAHFKDGESDIAAFTFNPKNPNRGNACVEQGMYGCFRPIRTPEQIEAEERAETIARMCRDIERAPQIVQANSTLEISVAMRLVVEALHTAGYRKQVAP